ncbi:unnamed protein product [Ilex paraguariensis]|uniref:WRKY domain-containing protein n=1 Tax=Ilex paraguariensis TaxID=185542 RepID=A0ABC8TDE3_9AQUA
MEVKDAERIVIAKPVASKPTYSSFRSFSQLLAGAISASPSNTCPDAAVTAIRPKTVRLKPVANLPPVGVISSQNGISGAAIVNSSDQVQKLESKSTVVYKPRAKVVSKTTVSLLANLVNTNIRHQQTLSQVEAYVQSPNEVKHHLKSNLSLNLHQDSESQLETKKAVEASTMASENSEEDQKSSHPPNNGVRPSHDGYNWRKYGQKQVKGSEFPRSYYKCTHPNCPVKKKVERSLDGQITEIVYKCEHNHSKPQHLKHNTSGGQGQAFVFDGTGQDTDNPFRSKQLSERIEGSQGKGSSVNSTSPDKALLCDLATAGTFKAGIPAPDNSCGLSSDCEQGSKGIEAEDAEPKRKRRKNENQSHETGISQDGVQDPCIVVQNSADSEITGDGFRWRKYGQKVVKGNPYPR